MEATITTHQLKALSARERKALEAWFDESAGSDDIVHIFIPEEESGESGGIFIGSWDSEHEFVYPEPYIGKLRNHRGTILPLLTTDQMIALLDTYDNDNLAFRLHLLLHEPDPGQKRWSFDTSALLETLWQGCLEVLARIGD